MSIVTKTGDAGTTALMYNRRVSKTHPRVEAYGCVDELNSALGCARAAGEGNPAARRLLPIQQELVALMGELATLPEDLERYTRSGLARLTHESTARLDQWVAELEAQKISFQGWATPGANLYSAHLDLARAICRRAERRVCGLNDEGGLHNAEIIVFLNRLSDLLWLLARAAEAPPESIAQPV